MVMEGLRVGIMEMESKWEKGGTSGASWQGVADLEVLHVEEGRVRISLWGRGANGIGMDSWF